MFSLVWKGGDIIGLQHIDWWRSRPRDGHINPYIGEDIKKVWLLCFFSYKDYMSMVRGGHNFMQIRFSHSPVYTYSSKVDIILALSQETIDIHRWKLKDKGGNNC